MPRGRVPCWKDPAGETVAVLGGVLTKHIVNLLAEVDDQVYPTTSFAKSEMSTIHLIRWTVLLDELHKVDERGRP